MVNLVIFAPTPTHPRPPPRAQLRPQRGSSAKPDPGCGVGMSPCPFPWIVPKGAWLSYGNAAGREGDPRDPRGGSAQSLGCSPAGFWVGSEHYFRVKPEHFGGVHATSTARSAGGGQLDPTTPILALLASGSPPCSWHPPPSSPQIPPPQPFPGHKTQTCLDKGVTGWG